MKISSFAYLPLHRLNKNHGHSCTDNNEMIWDTFHTNVSMAKSSLTHMNYSIVISVQDPLLRGGYTVLKLTPIQVTGYKSTILQVTG